MRQKKIFAQLQPYGDGHQVSYDTGDSRRRHHFPQAEHSNEPAPHGADSFHNPEHHHDLVERLEAYLREKP